MKKLSIVIPVFHEEKNIVNLFKSLRQYIKTNHEILIIYDTYADPTVEVINRYLKMNKKFDNIFLIKNSGGNGLGALNAIKTGFKKAKGNAVLVLMADLSDDLSMVDKMYGKIEEGYDIVCGSRYMPGGKKIGGPPLKTFLSKFAGLSLHHLFKIPTHDPTNAFKMYKKVLIDSINIESTGGFEYSLEILAKAYEKNYKITELPSVWNDRETGKSKFKLIKWLPKYIKWYLRTAFAGAAKIDIPYGINLYYITLFLFVLFFELNKIGRNINDKIPITSSLDFSWQADFVERLLHGFIAGKDFVFTYGPLYQFIYSIPSIFFKLPSYVTVAYMPLISIIIIYFMLLYFTKLLVSANLESAIFFSFMLFAVGLVALDSSDLIKVFLPMLFSLIWYKYLFSKKPTKSGIILIPALPTIFGAFAYDIFIYCLIITLSFSVIKFAAKKINRNGRQFIHFIPLILIFFYQVIFSFFLSGSLNYIIYSLDTVKNFTQTLNSKWSFGGNAVLFIFPLFLLFLSVYILVHKDKIGTHKANALLVLIFVSLLSVESAFIRSDAGHITRSLYPSIISTFVAFYFLIKHKTKLLLAGLILFVFIPNKPVYSFSLGYIKTAFSTAVKKPSFIKLYKLQSTTYGAKDMSYLSSFIKENKGNVFVYPYDNFLLDINGTTYNSFPMQFYDYSESITEINAVRKMKKNPPEYIVFGIDGKGALDLDQVPNLTRNSIFFEWVLNHYSVLENHKKFLILKYTPRKSFSYDDFQYGKCSLFGLKIISEKHFYNPIDILTQPIKQQIFYFSYDGILIRLPKVQSGEEYLIFKGYKNSSRMAKLFKKKWNFDKYYMKNVDAQNIRIIKYGFFALSKHIFSVSNQDVQIKCYN